MSSDADAKAALQAHPFPANAWVTVGDDAIHIRAGYSETLQRMLRWVPNARWQADRRGWVIPLAGAELVRSVLPEISRLAEAMEEDGRPVVQALAPAPGAGAVAGTGAADDAATGATADAADTRARMLFRDAARSLYGSDWQRDTARALQRDEAALACWLAGEGVAEAPPGQLLAEMLALMRRRAAAMLRAADALELAIAAPGRTGLPGKAGAA